MGDIAEQTLAGATSTGTHGTGGVAASLSAQIAGLELVTGTGEVARAPPPTENPDDPRVRPGRPRRPRRAHHAHLPRRAALRARGQRDADELGRGARRLRRADRRAPPRRHLLVPAHRPDADQDQRPARRRPRRGRAAARGCAPGGRRVPLQHALRRRSTAVTNRVPAHRSARFNQVSSRLLSARTYSDVAHQVFTAPRDVVFREMEYAVPREAGLAALREARARSRPRT